MWWQSQVRAEGARYSRSHAAVAVVCAGAFDFQYKGTQTVVDGMRSGARCMRFWQRRLGAENICVRVGGTRDHVHVALYISADGDDGEAGGEAEGFVGEVDQDQGAGVREVRMAARVCGFFRWVERPDGTWGAVYRWAE